MSIVAEFAKSINTKNHRYNQRILTPVEYPSRVDKLYDIRAVIFDVYGTLINYWRPEFADSERKEKALLASFKKTADYFGFNEFLLKIDPANPPEQTLKDFYHGLIALNHEKKVSKGISFPEVKIEEIWEIIVKMLERHGYDPSKPGLGDKSDLARCIAYYYNFFALSGGFYAGAADALVALKNDSFKLGILSNAQFYTLIDLTLALRNQTKNGFVDYQEIFDIDLTFFSYDYGVAKPNQKLFRALFDALYEYQVLPSQTVFVGNDLSSDIKPAAEAGMRTAFFTGDAMSAFVHDLGGKVIPDITFDKWQELPGKISLYQEKPSDRIGS